MTQYSMDAEIAPVKNASSNNAADCKQLADRFIQGFYKIPLFQRQKLLWPMEQRRSFIKRLWEGPEPVGSIVIYQTEDNNDDSLYILDGLQRLSTIAEFSESPDKYDVSDKERVIKLLMTNSFPVQMRTYKDHMHAYLDFIRLQQNLQLTAYEQFFGKRSLLRSWRWFASIEAEIHSKVDRVLSSYGLKDVTVREEKHQYMRHNLSLFLRSATKNTQIEPWIIKRSVSPRNESKHVEAHLADYLERSKQSDIESSAKEFYGRLDAHRGTIHAAWHKVNDVIGKPPTKTVVRFLHTIGIYCKANGISDPRFAQFVFDVLDYAKGDTQFFYEGKNGRQEKITLAMDSVGDIRQILNARITTSDITISDIKLRGQEPTLRTERGFDAGHDAPLSRYGQGPKTPEPTSANRSKGNRHNPISLG